MVQQKNSLEEKQASQPSAQSTKRDLPKANFFTSVTQTGRSLLETGSAIANTVGNVGEAIAQQAVRLVGQGTQGAGHTIHWVGNLPLLRRFAGVLKLDWLVGMSDRVDLAKAEAEVTKLQAQYPNESASQIAHRIMVQKALQAGGIGLASSILPGFAAALLAIDLAATTAIQTEMVYQIAAAYGMDLQDPTRKGEILGIFGLALGGRNALKAGLGFLRNVPLAGAAIGAGTNATMLYSLGYAACRFYEAKLKSDTSEPTTETLKSIQQESEQYLNVAIAQQAVMDQILVHMILASYPDKSWNDILPELKKLQVDQNSVNTIAQHLQSPQPLDTLLQQLNCDFAVPLLSQCRIIAEQNALSEQEMQVIQAIEQKCPSSANLDATN